jgi:AI-2E family transporter
MPETETTPFLSNAQRRLLAFALGLFAVVAIIALLVFVIVVLGDLVGFFSGVLWPLAVAGVLALILRPVVDLLEKRFNGRRSLAVSLLYAVFLLFVAALLITAIPPLVEQVLDFIAFLPTFWTKATAYVKDHYPSWVTLGERLLPCRAKPARQPAIRVEQTPQPRRPLAQGHESGHRLGVRFHHSRRDHPHLPFLLSTGSARSYPRPARTPALPPTGNSRRRGLPRPGVR